METTYVSICTVVPVLQHGTHDGEVVFPPTEQALSPMPADSFNDNPARQVLRRSVLRVNLLGFRLGV